MLDLVIVKVCAEELKRGSKALLAGIGNTALGVLNMFFLNHTRGFHQETHLLVVERFIPGLEVGAQLIVKSP